MSQFNASLLNFTDLSFQAAQRVMSASSTDALKVLKDVSQNSPMLARSLFIYYFIYFFNFLDVLSK